MPLPKPRQGRYLGMAIQNTTFPDGTWLEGEEFCYPDGNMTRRAYAECADGKNRVFIAGIADTFFSIPARGKIGGKSVRGILTKSTTGLEFTQQTKP